MNFAVNFVGPTGCQEEDKEDAICFMMKQNVELISLARLRCIRHLCTTSSPFSACPASPGKDTILHDTTRY